MFTVIARVLLGCLLGVILAGASAIVPQLFFLFCVRSSVFISVVVLKRSTLWYVYCHVLLYLMFHVHVSELLNCTHTRLGFVFACGQAMLRQGPCVHDVWPGGGRNTRIENRRIVSTVIARLFSSCVWVWFSLAHGS